LVSVDVTAGLGLPEPVGTAAADAVPVGEAPVLPGVAEGVAVARLRADVLGPPALAVAEAVEAAAAAFEEGEAGDAVRPALVPAVCVDRCAAGCAGWVAALPGRWVGWWVGRGVDRCVGCGLGVGFGLGLGLGLGVLDGRGDTGAGCGSARVAPSNRQPMNPPAGTLRDPMPTLA